MVPFLIIFLELTEFINLLKKLKNKPFSNIGWIIFDQIILHLALLNFFKTASLRFTIIVSFIIEAFIVLLTGGIHPKIRKAILLCCSFVRNKK
jgi:hypothetical protein